MEGTYEYPHQHWEEYAPAPKPTADLRELARSYLLSVPGPNQSVPTDEIAQAISDKYSELACKKGERWEKSLKERLRTFYCFNGHTQKGSRVPNYACDSTVDPSLKRTQGQKRKQGSSSVTPGPSTRTQSPAPELDSPAAARPKKRQKKASKPSILALSIPAPAIKEALVAAPQAEPSIVQQQDEQAAAAESGQSAAEDHTGIVKAEPIAPIARDPVNIPTVDDIAEPPDQPTANGFSFDTSIVFEYKDNNHDGSIFYGMQCGPYVIKRRRRDSQFPLAPLLKLIRLAFGPAIKGEAAQKLVEQEEEDGLASMLLSKPTVSFASLAHVRAVADECNLLLFLSPLLADNLPNLPEDHPISRPAPAGVFAKDLICRYCNHACISKSELRRHQIINAGTCQLEQPRHQATYQTLLDTDIQMMQKRQLGMKEDSSSLNLHLAHSSEFQLIYQEEQDSEKAAQCDGSSLQPSLLYWSSAEKERFFFALERYSRFRPDMIADHVKTKTVGEVSAYLSVLEDGLSLLDTSHTDPSPHLSAREMSDRWLEHEETLSSDAALWEIFTSQASITPWEKRDFAQLAALQKSGRAHCRQCPRGACDAAWPTCGRCTKRGQPCRWIRGFHPQALPEHMAQIKAALKPLGEVPPPSTESDISILHNSMMESLSWHQLTALSYHQSEYSDLPNDVERTWSEEGFQSTSQAKNKSRTISRKVLSDLLQEAGLSSLPSDRKEKIYKAVKRDLRQDETKGLPTSAELQRYNRAENVKARVSDRIINIKKALRWQDLSISNASDTHWAKKPELAGIQDDIHLAARQLRLTGLRGGTLGPTADMFDLGKLALLLDLHRLGSDDDGCISKAAIHVLYDLLSRYVRKIVATAVTLLEVRHGNEEWGTKLKRKCMEDAITQNNPTNPKANTHSLDLDNPFDPPTVNWYSQGTFNAFGNDLDILPSADFDDIEFHGEDSDSEALNSDEDEDDTEEQQEELELELDKQIDEKDQLEDHLYEERLWMLFKARDKRDDNDEQDEEDEDEEDRRERMDLEDDEGSENDDERGGVDVETTDVGEETEDGRTNNDEEAESDDNERQNAREESEAGLTQTHEKRHASDHTTQKHKNKAMTIKANSNAKQAFKSQEFISTSDEEEL